MKKIHFDSAMLSGLAGVSPDDEPGGDPQTSDTNEIGQNPKYVLISLYEKDSQEEGSIDVEKTIPNPTIYRTRDILTPDEFVKRKLYTEHVLKLVFEHFEKYGTIQEIRFVGDGCRGMMGGKEQQPFIVSWFLNELANYESLHGKVANRVVFDACNTFRELSDDDVKYYSDYAEGNHTQLVGTTSETGTVVNIYGTHFNVGRYVQFSPTGKIIRDRLDTRYSPNMLFMSNDRSWTDFYIGHTAKEGAALKKRYEQQRQENDQWFIKHQRDLF
jgi:hypothetical protein